VTAERYGECGRDGGIFRDGVVIDRLGHGCFRPELQVSFVPSRCAPNPDWRGGEMMLLCCLGTKDVTGFGKVSVHPKSRRWLPFPAN
jgi:hypothetical protein